MPRTAPARHGHRVRLPAQGPDRELKKAVEGYWEGRSSPRRLRAAAEPAAGEDRDTSPHAGLDAVPGETSRSTTTSWTPASWSAPSPRGTAPSADPLDGYFAMARGTQDVAPLEMTKWFDTNYHYLVPEMGPTPSSPPTPTKQVAELRRGAGLGLTARPVLVGPVTYLLLAKPRPRSRPLRPCSLDRLLPVYAEVLADLRAAGAGWVQLDEPALVQDRTAGRTGRRRPRLPRPGRARPTGPKLLVASYFDRLGEALPVLARPRSRVWRWTSPGRPPTSTRSPPSAGCPASGWSPASSTAATSGSTTCERSLSTLGTLLGLRRPVDVAASCSLLHVPLDAGGERDIDPQILRWLAFARQKADEIVTLARGLADGTDAITANSPPTAPTWPPARRSPRHPRPGGARPGRRRHRRRRAAAPSRTPSAPPPSAPGCALPALPTTTIGSFPQTAELRTRPGRPAGRPDRPRPATRSAIAAEIGEVIAFQEKTGLDVLVHGEPERNDMVQYFAEQLTGYLATRHGWVQSYGTRYVRPPILAGDISRPRADDGRAGPRYAQSLTDRPVKGMLTGPVTMLAWSFVRDDQPLGDTARQVALALRDEVADLEAAGTAVIQVDEPALRETLPLRAADRPGVPAPGPPRRSGWPPAGVRPDTQIHTHMCYAEFGDIVAGHRRPRRRRHQPGGGPLAHAGRRRTRRARLSARGRPRRLRHPLAARPERRRGRPRCCARALAAFPPSGCGSTRTAA